MGKAQGPGPGSRVDNPQDVEVTGDLPMSLTAFVGRERELDELRSLFREGKRLVTLVGIGGIGKTRLALELGFSARDLGWAKVYWVELASLADPGLVDGVVREPRSAATTAGRSGAMAGSSAQWPSGLLLSSFTERPVVSAPGHPLAVVPRERLRIS